MSKGRNPKKSLLDKAKELVSNTTVEETVDVSPEVAVETDEQVEQPTEEVVVVVENEATILNEYMPPLEEVKQPKKVVRPQVSESAAMKWHRG